MSFVISSITPADRMEHKLDDFDAMHPMSKPQLNWAIDRHREIFFRVLYPYARKLEPADPDSMNEVDYHLRWERTDFIFAVRHIRDGLSELPGTLFLDGEQESGTADYSIYLRHITLLNNKKPPRPPGSKAVVNLFLEAMKASQGGLLLLTAEGPPSISSRVILKLAPEVGRTWVGLAPPRI